MGATTGLQPDVGTALPEGCGDGIPVPGQFCFTMVDLPTYGSVNNVVGLDLNGDGRDEVLVNDVDPTVNAVFPLFYDGVTFEEGVGAEGLSTSSAQVRTDLDFDGDGVLDLLRSTSGGGVAGVLVYRNTGMTLIRELHNFGSPKHGAAAGGRPVVLDTDGDGVAEVLASDTNVGAQLYRRKGDAWKAVGPHMDLPGCNQKDNGAVGDFNEDGLADALVDNGWNSCDFGPGTYDPEWHQFGVFLSNSQTGLLDLVETIPTGEILGTGAWVGDVDGDGHLDGLFDPSAGPGVVFVQGRGDGTFEDARVIRELAGAVSWDIDDIGDFDGDGTLDLSARIDGHLAFITDLTGAIAFAFPEPFRFSSNVHPAADYNGDGIADLAVRDVDRGPNKQVALLLSTP